MQKTIISAPQERYLFNIDGYAIYKCFSCYKAVSDTKTKINSNFDNLISSL